MENKKTLLYRNFVHFLGLSWFYSSKLWRNVLVRKCAIPLCLILMAYGIFHFGCWHINYEGIPATISNSSVFPLSTKVLGYCDSINFYGIFNDDPRNRWISGELINLFLAGMCVLLAIKIMFVKTK